MKALLRSLLSRCSSHFRRRMLEAEMAEEMQAHLEVLTEEYVAAGLSPAEARLAARKRFGGVAQLQERCRDEQRFVWLEQVGKDVAFAARSLARARGFSLTVLAMLVLGIGTATLMFGLTSSILFFAPPFPHPEQLVLIGCKDKRGTSYPYRPAIVFRAYQEQTNVFSEFAAVTRDVGNVVVDGEPVVVNLMSVSVDCFRTLGIRPAMGRGFLAEEFRPGGNRVVVITDGFWRKYLNSAPDVLGRGVMIDQQPCTVVGVLARGQMFPVAFGGEVYRPSALEPDGQVTLGPTVFAIGRLAPRVSPEQARAALAAVKLPTLPPWAVQFLSEQEPLLMDITEIARPETYWVIAIGAMLLYGIACLNAMNLMLLRLLGRQRELSIRLALGGTRGQVARLLVIESVGLSLVACAIVMAAAHWLFPRLLALTFGADPADYGSLLGGRTLACIAIATLLASVAVALVPVWRLLRGEINPGLKDGGMAGEGRGMARMRSSLVIAQAALAVILLAGTGLMMRSFERLYRASYGFEPSGRVKVVITVPRDYDLKPEARLQLFQQLQQGLAALPGVRAVSFGQDSLLIGAFAGTAQVLTPDGTYQSVVGSFVAADYLKTAGVVLKRGRWLSGKRGEHESMINETMARTLFGEEEPVGRSYKLLVTGDYNHLVVGVVSDVAQTVRSKPGMQVYWPDWAYPMNISTLVLRLDADPGKEFAGFVRHAIYRIDPKLIASQVSTINETIGNGMWAERFAFRVLKLLTGIAVGLAAAGLFSVVAYTVDSRMKEFGVRLALGARPANLHRLVMRRGLATAGIGIVVGVAGALALTRFMQSLLFETAPYDPLVYVAVAAVLLVAAAAACWLPARRAARVDITKLLRTE